MIFNASFNMLFAFKLEKYITYATLNLRLPYYYLSEKFKKGTGHCINALSIYYVMVKLPHPEF